MTDITLTRFNKIPSGYRRHDTKDWANGAGFAAVLNAWIEHRTGREDFQPEAWSFSKFKAGKMSGETWVSASAIILEYHVDRDMDAGERFEEIINAADALGYGFYLIGTTTRKGAPTISLVFPLSNEVDERRYIRIASVLATQLGLGRAAVGIKAHTHLIHITADSAARYCPGPVINPDFFIKVTKNEAQNFDPAQFEAAIPKIVPKMPAPANTACDDRLFDWG